jgi:hypothetical protein
MTAVGFRPSGRSWVALDAFLDSVFGGLFDGRFSLSYSTCFRTPARCSVYPHAEGDVAQVRVKQLKLSGVGKRSVESLLMSGRGMCCRCILGRLSLLGNHLFQSHPFPLRVQLCEGQPDVLALCGTPMV